MTTRPPGRDPLAPPADAATRALLARVRKLLAKAEDPAATPAEAETYTAKATELVAAYGIDAALLAAADPRADRVGDRLVVLDAPYGRDKASLLATVAQSLRCQVVQRTRRLDGATQLSLHLFGFGADLHRVELLWTSLLVQATSQLARVPAPPGEPLAAYRRSWLAGFTSAVGQRLAAAEREAAEEAAGRQEAGAGAAAPGGRSVALVLADRSADVEQRLQAEYPLLGRARRRELTGSGAGAGWQAGQRADLGGGRVGPADANALTG
ncbi:MAG: DUF2786 domain-containing protein [Nocardioides sp.]